MVVLSVVVLKNIDYINHQHCLFTLLYGLYITKARETPIKAGKSIANNFLLPTLECPSRSCTHGIVCYK